MAFTVPLLIHGDDAEAHRRRSFQITTMSSAVVTGSPWDTKLLLYCCDNARTTGDTVFTLDLWVAWSLTELQLGFFLDVDPYNRPYSPFNQGRKGCIAGPWRAILAIHKGDEKYIQKAYKTQTSWVSKQVCWTCAASSGDAMVYTQYGPCAPHREAKLSSAEFIQSTCGQNPWVRVPGWSPQVLHYDWLHVIDLAVAPEAAASVPWMYE